MINASKILLATVLLFFSGACNQSQVEKSHDHSPYSGQENRALKGLSDSDIAGYRNGEGMGLAKTAELNGFPGPKHVLENASALDLTPEQKIAVEQTFQKMKNQAVDLGKQIIESETELDALFAQNKIESLILDERTRSIAKLQGDLRKTHLEAHLEMMKILSPEQIRKYKEIRGYVN